MSINIVIVGGVAGGASAAAKALVIMAGFDAANTRRGEVKNTHRGRITKKLVTNTSGS
jgi:hypothetical protein